MKMVATGATMLAVLIFCAAPAGANLLVNSGFETGHVDNYVAPIYSGGMPAIVGSSLWIDEVVGAWALNSVYSAWRASDPEGQSGYVVNLRKQTNGFMQAVDATGLVNGTELTLQYRLYLQPEADDAATIFVRLLGVTTAGAGEAATTVDCGPVNDLSKILDGEAGNFTELGSANTAVAGVARGQWVQVAQPITYTGAWDYLVVVVGYAGAPNSYAYLLDDVELWAPPLVAYAGPDQAVLDADGDGFESITLDGSGSGATGSTIVSYAWTEDGALIANGVTAAVDFAVGSHPVMLTITDDGGATASDTVQIDVLTSAPVADAGPDQRLADEDRDGSEPVALDGRGSTDPNGSIIAYLWREGETLLATGEVAQTTLPVGLHTISLEVIDDESLSATDTVEINVREVPVLLGNEISPYKSGVSLEVLGVYGLDYLVENFYHDPLVDPRCTIYIRDDVALKMFHNEMNLIAGDVVGADGGGIIRYRVDQNLTIRAKWAGYDRLWPAYTEPVSFSQMQYDPGAPVVGVTGPLPGVSIADRDNFYWRGMVGPAGDEWHVIAVGDDDEDPARYYDGWSSDGKIFYCVVNPTTPSVALVKNSSDAQWYTTLPKAYFVPKIHVQTTYLGGDIDIELAALDAAEVQYSLRVEGDAADDWSVYTAPINTLAAGLQADTRYELRYRIGADGPVKMRILHFAPSYPSDGETHPNNILWKDQAGFEAIRQRVLDTDPARQVYQDTYNKVVNDSWYHQRGRTTLMNGDRRNTIGLAMLCNAFPLIIDGFDQHPEASAFLREAMLDNILNLDPVGLEGNHATNNPCKELNYQGYYSVTTPLAMALAYDWVIKDMRAGIHPDGFTAIEDHKMRDMLAAFCLHTAFRFTDPYSQWYDENGYCTGMWTTAWLFGSQIVAAVMPNYDGDMYGTSGAPEGVFNAPRPWTPYPDTPITWWDLAADKYAPIPGYPNQHKRSGFWGLLNEDIEWIDRAGYWGGRMMGWLYYLNANFRVNYDNYRYPHFEEAFNQIIDGVLMPGKSPEEGPLHHYSALLVNHNFPVQAAKIAPVLTAGTAVSEESINYSVAYHQVLGLCLYEDDWNASPVVPGDANGDGHVTIDDFVILKNNFGTPSGATVAQGDFNGDGAVTIDDFVILKNNFGR